MIQEELKQTDSLLNEQAFEQRSSSGEDQSETDEELIKDFQEEPLTTTDGGCVTNNDGRNTRLNEKDDSFLSRDMIPPPEPLLPKTIVPNEPLRTGAPTPFLKLKPFQVGSEEIPVKQNEDIIDKSKYKIDNPILNEQSLKTLFLQEFKQNESNPVVYNRSMPQFGMGQSAYQNSAYQILKSEFNPMTLLINVKELMQSENQKAQNSGQIVLPYYTPQDGNDKTLVFESRFESGNLAVAFKTSENEYNLVLQNDINTKGHTQWFFFRVTNTFKNFSVKFNILNHTKTDSLFNYGMKVLVYSECKYKNTGISWHRDGRDIAYFQNNFKKDTVGRSRYYYTLTFTYDFQFDEDVVFFAYSYPYTYSDLTEELTAMERDAVKQEYINRNILCRTIAGNKCEYLTITNKNHPDQKQERKGVFLSARIHPGESNSSWMMKGAIDFLVSQAPEAIVLREKFVFKIVPMLNPDGVINGNYRCSLAGADLNRRWKTTSKLLYPEVFETKKLCKQFQRERQIVLYCDLHGHSRNKNIFIYGNNYQENPESTRLFPFIMSKICDSFAFENSRFSIHKSKESTARVAMWRELKIPAVYTMEASFCGPKIGKNAGLHFTTEHLMEAGKKLCIALLIYCDVDVPKSLKEMQSKRIKKNTKKGQNGVIPVPTQINQTSQVSQELIDLEIAEELKKYTRKQLIAELIGDKGLLNSGGKDENSEDGGGSDSEPSEDNMEEEEMAKIMPIKVSPTKKKQDVKKQLPIRKQFKQEETKEQKQQQTQVAKKSPIKKFNTGGSFFDRVRLPKSYGMRRVEMVDAWTQTSNKGSDTEGDPNKDEGIQAILNSKDQNESALDVTPNKQKINTHESVSITNPERSLFNIDSLRNNDTISSQSVIVSNSNKNRILVPQNQQNQKRSSLSPNKTEFQQIKDRMQAMQIINQYIKESQMTLKTTPNQQNSQNAQDPYNFFLQNQQYYSPDKLSQQIHNHMYHTEKKPKMNSQLSQQKQYYLDNSMNQIHKRQSSNNPQNYYQDGQNATLLQQLNLNRGSSEGNQAVNNLLNNQNQKTLEFKEFIQSQSQISSQLQHQLPQNVSQSNRLGNQQNAFQTSNTTNHNQRSLSGSNSYLRQKKQGQDLNAKLLQQQQQQQQNNLNLSVVYNNINTNNSNINQSLPAAPNYNSQNSKQQMNNSYTTQNTTSGNNRGTTLPQLNDSLQKNQAIKQNKSQCFYEGIKPSGSFKLQGGGLIMNSKLEQKQVGNGSALNMNEEQLFNNSFIRGSISPTPFENMPHYSFKIKPTMIVNKSTTRQASNNNNANNTNNQHEITNKMYQSQPSNFNTNSNNIDDLNPQIINTQDLIASQIGSKMPIKNRAQNNLMNSGGSTQNQAYNMTGLLSSQNTSHLIEENNKKKQQVSIVKKRKTSDSVSAGGITSKSFIQTTNQSILLQGSGAMPLGITANGVGLSTGGLGIGSGSGAAVGISGSYKKNPKGAAGFRKQQKQP